MPNLRIKRRISSFQTIIIGFAAVILIGSFLLCLPISSNCREWTNFTDSLFTATSAVCVTGLIVFDTATHWSYFGQAVILLLIQIGGLGVITVAASFAFISGRKISLMQRSTMRDAISAQKVGGVVKLTLFIIIGTFLIEFIAALAMLPVFCRDYGIKGIWMSFFHSISAFCNAGFDIMGSANNQFSSLTYYVENPLVNIIIMLLIVVGGIGFLTWDDIKTHHIHIKKYRMQSKVVLVTTAILIVLPALYFFYFEYNDYPIKKRVLVSLFQAVTPRTAGFNTVDLSTLHGVGFAIMISLMLIGGSPGSTAGGMKTTTFAVMFSNAWSVFRRKEHTQFFGRRIGDEAVKNAATVFIMSISLFLGGSIAISLIESLPFRECMFETASAVGTVGLSLGITPTLSTASHLILIVLMFLGRVGGLTVIYATLSGKNTNLSKYPEEKITIG